MSGDNLPGTLFQRLEADDFRSRSFHLCFQLPACHGVAVGFFCDSQTIRLVHKGQRFRDFLLCRVIDRLCFARIALKAGRHRKRDFRIVQLVISSDQRVVSRQPVFIGSLHAKSSMLTLQRQPFLLCGGIQLLLNGNQYLHAGKGCFKENIACLNCHTGNHMDFGDGQGCSVRQSEGDILSF